ncbi:nitroreductase family protein [Streptomyces sp. WMMC500]|uniref:Acg family FMN-binding oxidoreductase n=1 Tax=Streptomyces sp. WMMC500 TaxID=3015154 RepID=UPI00248CF3A0|nr:nitroreductase family protein [Streptomyces sp. WMMC500]WBB61941.1 nitroreductase family protein [Streptomyces sp. WMMC500]
MPVKTLDAQTLETLISAAAAAPSIHNTQPWRYRLDPDTVTLEAYAVTERGLPHTDPSGRALHVSVGASVFNLCVGVAHFGWTPIVRLLPRPKEPRLLATVRLAGGSPARNGHRADLYPAIWRRRSSRYPFADRRPPAELLTELSAAAHTAGTDLKLPDPAETAHLLQLTAEAERRSTGDALKRMESRRWLRNEGVLGIPTAALGPMDAAERIPMRDFADRADTRTPAAVFERKPTLALLTTGHDRRVDWLRTGQALEHVLLVATAHGLRYSLLHQGMEWPDVREALRDVRGGGGHVQMLIRFGYGPQGPPTPRSPAGDVLTAGAPVRG